MARNIFYGGTVFFILVFVGLILHTETRIPARSKSAEITAEVAVREHTTEFYWTKPLFRLRKHAGDRSPALGDSCQPFLTAIVFEVQVIRMQT